MTYSKVEKRSAITYILNNLVVDSSGYGYFYLSHDLAEKMHNYPYVPSYKLLCWYGNGKLRISYQPLNFKAARFGVFCLPHIKPYMFEALFSNKTINALLRGMKKAGYIFNSNGTIEKIPDLT